MYVNKKIHLSWIGTKIKHGNLNNSAREQQSSKDMEYTTRSSTKNKAHSEQNGQRSIRAKIVPSVPNLTHSLPPFLTPSSQRGHIPANTEWIKDLKKQKKQKRKGGTIHLFILLSFLRSNKAASKTILSNSGKPQSHKEKGAVRGAIKQCCWRCPPAYTLQSVSFWVLLAGHSYPSGLSVPGVISRTVTSLFGGGNTSFRKPTKILTLLESVGQDFTSLSNKSHVRILGRCLVSSLRSCSCYVGLPGGRS